MIQVRSNVFETNSSSTHSLTMCSNDEFEKFKKGELVLQYGYKLVPLEEGLKEYPEATNAEELQEVSYGDYQTWDNLGGDFMECFHEEYVTPSGEKVHAFGYFGYDG